MLDFHSLYYRNVLLLEKYNTPKVSKVTPDSKVTLIDGNQRKTRTLGNVRKLRRVHLGTSAIQVNERDTGEQAEVQPRNIF